MSSQQGRIERATRQQLRDAGVSVQDNGLAASAVALARILDEGVGARDHAAVAREHRAGLAELAKVANAVGPLSTLDELRARRDARRGTG